MCKYASTVQLKRESVNDQDRYKEARIGCYCLDARYKGEWCTFNATLTLRDPARYINHASNHCNLALMPPIMIGRGSKQRLQIGFLAKAAISPGDQLFSTMGTEINPG